MFAFLAAEFILQRVPRPNPVTYFKNQLPLFSAINSQLFQSAYMALL